MLLPRVLRSTRDRLVTATAAVPAASPAKFQPQSLPHTLEQVRANCLRQHAIAWATDAESCVLQLYLNAAHACDARLEFRDGGAAQGAITASAVVVSLPERSAAFVRAFVDAFVEQKTNDGYEVVDSRVAAQPEGEAAPSPHSPKPSSPTEGEAAGTEGSLDCEQGQSQEPKGQTSIEKLARHFHLPINAAGRELGICPTVLKKICRKHGLTRWPHRKLRSIDRLLEKLRASVEQADRPFGSSVHTKNLRDKISELLRERQEICFEQRPH